MSVSRARWGSAILVVGDANAILGDRLSPILSRFVVIVCVYLSVWAIVATRQVGAVCWLQLLKMTAATRKVCSNVHCSELRGQKQFRWLLFLSSGDGSGECLPHVAVVDRAGGQIDNR